MKVTRSKSFQTAGNMSKWWVFENLFKNYELFCEVFSYPPKICDCDFYFERIY